MGKRQERQQAQKHQRQALAGQMMRTGQELGLSRTQGEIERKAGNLRPFFFLCGHKVNALTGSKGMKVQDMSFVVMMYT